jgi:hypothetical protein
VPIRPATAGSRRRGPRPSREPTVAVAAVGLARPTGLVDTAGSAEPAQRTRPARAAEAIEPAGNTRRARGAEAAE